uniref:Uncharacterized protein n=1 Tax=Euplotes harpa TaxID=151035 RepID=A0A7S3J6U8_9SPIT|mmetsp:Transcript_18588/g.21357  ORF Transcript_18588/g.21357 Transcript_18588/m.21357 type:complete len:252 (+) Transcript_18588:307-1062(+)
MKERLADYINAIEYLKKNDFSKDQQQIKVLLEKAEAIKALQKRYKNGDEVEIYEIPGEVTPDDLFGISARDRIKKFQNYMAFVNKTMNELKLVGGNNFKIFNATKSHTAKENYQKSITLFKTQAALKKTFVDLAKNRWQPMPELQKITESFPNVQENGVALTAIKTKIFIPDELRNDKKFYYIVELWEADSLLKATKVPNKNEEQVASIEVDLGHHKNLSILKILIKVMIGRCILSDVTEETFDVKLLGFK